MTNNKNKKGFTLIELLVVIAIIGILSAIGLVSLNGAREKARDAQARTDLSTMRTALALWYDDHNNTYPGTTAVNSLDVSDIKTGTGHTANSVFDTAREFEIEYVANLKSPSSVSAHRYGYKSSAILANISSGTGLGTAGAYVVDYVLEGAGGTIYYSVDSLNNVKDVADAKTAMTDCVTDASSTNYNGTCAQ